MIKFFRNIRQNMINQNKTKKYLLYAIGEQSYADLANNLREAKDAFLNNAAIHYWINIDAIKQYKELIEDTNAIIKSLEQELE